MDTARVYLHTLGCPKNDADSDSLSRRLAAGQVTVVGRPEEATHILVNTCGFTQEAKEESIAAILETKATYPETELLVMGCLVERYRPELQEGLPEVEGWFGLGDQPILLERLRRSVQAGEAGTMAATPVPDPTWTTAPSAPARTFAYVKISDGCDHPCSFCAIPGIKGPYRGIDPSTILREAAAALDEGARELVLVGQDTALWAEGGWRLRDLVGRLADDDRVRWLRLLYFQPEHVDDELLQTVSEQPKVVPYLDIPFQHAARRVLRRMARRGDGDAYLDLLARVREAIPGVSLRSTFIVGFPGETEEDFEELLDFVARAGFAHAGAFVYSPEEGTPAARLSPLVPDPVARGRLTRLSSLLLDLAETRNEAAVGTRVEVMLDAVYRPEVGEGQAMAAADGRDPSPLEDGPEGAVAVGRTPAQAPEIDGVTYLEGKTPPGAPGDIVSAVVTDAVGYDLVARWDGT